MATLIKRKKHVASPEAPASAREKAYLALQQKVLSGEYPAGFAISEASLARELGISRTPLREAVGQLIAQGFLRAIPNRGTVVLEFTKRDIAEMYEIREALEVYAVGRAAESRIQPADVEEIGRLADQVLTLQVELETSCRPRLDGRQMNRLVDMDLRYHARLMGVAANMRLMKMLGDTRVLLNVFALHRLGHDLQQLEQIHGYHRGILDAVVRQDVAGAQRLLGEHIRLSKQERLQEYEELERERALRDSISSWPMAEVTSKE